MPAPRFTGRARAALYPAEGGPAHGQAAVSNGGARRGVRTTPQGKGAGFRARYSVNPGATTSSTRSRFVYMSHSRSARPSHDTTGMG